MALVRCVDTDLSHAGDGGTAWFGQEQDMTLPVLGPLG